jgi:hypothetical protein
MVALPILQQADCSTFPCREECCSVGVDVWPPERERLIDAGLALESDFTGPELDEGDLLYRTAIGARGCVFLLPTRGCRLHVTGLKPSVCSEVPRDPEEVAELAGYGMMPCHDQWKWGDE